MENKSFLTKFLFLLIILVVITIIVFFFINKSSMGEDLETLEIITSMNVDTYDQDMYIYKMENNKIFTSEYFYNNYYLSNNTVTFDEFDIDENTKFYLKNLSNTEKDIENIKISYDPITLEQFNYLLNNNSLLKVYLWLDDNGNCKNILLYSSGNVELEIEHY